MTRDRPTEPSSAPLKADAVPDPLRERDSWVCWHVACRDCHTVYAFGDAPEECTTDGCQGEPSKVPVDPSTGYNAKSNDPDTWASFDDALAFHRDGDARTEGVGFMFTREGMVVGIDLDNVRDPVTGELEPWAEEIIEKTDSWTEVSVSGTGFHIYALGIKPGDRCRKGQESTLARFEKAEVEMYDGSSGRYFAVTGDHLEGTPETVEQRNDTVRAVYEEYLDDGADDGQNTLDDSPGGPVDLDDSDIVEKAKSAQNGDKFARLWRGNTTGYESHSEARQALANLLAFWSGGDEKRMLNLFRQSDLCRGDDDLRTFENYEIPTALDGRTDFYDPSGSGNDTQRQPNPSQDHGADPDDTRAWENVRWSYENEGKPVGRFAAANRLEEETSWMYVTDSKQLWVYDDDRGYFVPRGEDVARRRLEKRLRHHYSERDANEVIGRIEARNQTQRSELNARTRDDPLLCVGNGVVNLRTGALREHSPDLKFTRGVEWDYDPETATPTPVVEFLDELTKREADRDTLLDHLAHGLMPGHPYRAFVVMYGPGSNGKTKFGDVIQGFVGEENAAAVELQDLTGDDSFATGGLPGAFVNIGDDISVGEVRDTSILKSATGGGTIRANEKYEKKFNFENEAAMFFSANEPPRIRERTSAISDRLYPVEMPYRFVDEDEYDPDDPAHKRKDPRVAESLTNDPAAMRGLLLLAVEHAQRLIERDGRYSMPEPPSERRAIYEAASDPIKRFALDYLESGDGSARVVKDDAYTVYTEMCDREGERPADESTFKKIVGGMATLDTESTQTRTLTPGDSRVYAWKYLEFADDAKPLMPGRLQRRYFETTDDADASEDGDGPAFNATRLTDAAKSLTGYVTVTAEVVDVDTYGGGENATTKAVLKDESGAMDLVTWDGDMADRLNEHEGETVVVENAEVGEHNDARQLQPQVGLTEIRQIAQGVGHTEASAPADENQQQVTEAATDGGDVPEDATGRVVHYIRNECGGGDTLTVASVAGSTGLAPDTAEEALNTIQATKNLLGPAPDGYQVL